MESRMLAYWPAKLHMVMGVCLLAFLQHWTGVHAQFGLLGGAVAGLTGGLLQAGTPAVAYTGSLLGGLGLGIPAVTPTATQPATTTYTQPTTTYYTTSNPVTNPFGWLFPVYTPARRSNCVVYEGRANENIMQVANLFGLSYADLLRDNQGVINSPNEPLAGRSILLCGRNGQRPQPVQQPVPQRPVQQPAGPRGQVQVPRPAAAPATPVLQPVITRPAPVVTRPAPVPLPVPAARPNAPTPSGAVSLVPPSVQAQALLQVKTFIDPKTEILKDWATKLPHCTWIYVTCDANQNVVRLNLVYLGLSGKLPPGDVMKNLPHLTNIYLGGNLLKGTLPASWGTTVKPIELYLNDNMFQGPLPATWGSMKTLKVLSLPYNQLTGSLPPQWGQLVNLQVLKLNNNKLSGSVPQAWGGMTAIATVTIFNNQQMVGCVPEAWSGPGKTGAGFFQSPGGVLSEDIKDATRGTSITGFCCKGWKYCV